MSVDSARAFEILGLPETASAEEVKKAYRHLAMTTHPDQAAEATFATSRMVELNIAYERALEAVSEYVNPRCVCFGFIRSPLCKAHEAVADTLPKCERCGGTKKVTTGGGFSTLMVDCPDCT